MQVERLTIKTCVVRLDVQGLDLAILKLKSITLAARTTEDSAAIKCKV